MDVSLLSLCFQDDLHFALYLGHLPSWQFFELFPPRIWQLEFSSLEAMGLNLCTIFKWVNELNPFLAMWSSWSFCKVRSKRFLVDSWASTTMHAHVDLRVSDPFPKDSLHWRFWTSQGMADSMGSSSIFSALFMVSLDSLSSGAMKKRCLSTFAHGRASFSRQSIAACPFVELLFDVPDQISGHKCSGLVVAWIFLSRSPGPHALVWIIYSAFLQHIQCRMWSPDHGNISPVIHHCVHRLRLVRISSKIISAHFASFGSISCWGAFSDTLISSRQLSCSICVWEHENCNVTRRYYPLCIESPSKDFGHVQNFQLLNACDQNITFPKVHRGQCTSKECSRWNFLTKLMESWLVFV